MKHIVIVCLCLVSSADAEPLTLPLDDRPDWLRRDGIVMAGSWEALMMRARLFGDGSFTPTAEQRAAYEREHSPEMIARLKDLGVNFVMIHCYRGAIIPEPGWHLFCSWLMNGFAFYAALLVSALH